LLSSVVVSDAHMTSRNNPFDSLEDLFDRMSRQFEDAADAWESGETFESVTGSGGAMAVDFLDKPEEYVVTVNLPGFTADEIDVRVTDHTLRVSAHHDEEMQEGDERYLRRERQHRSLERSMRLPGEVEADGVTASMNNGVLTITIPKAEPREEGTRVEITPE
jgi:HSP20 family protein